MAICAFAASNSSRAERLSNSVEYQPPTKARPNSASLSFSAAPSLGSLWPFSMPTTPASLASARQVSSGVSPPISCRSSFVQPIGLAPMRMLMASLRPAAASAPPRSRGARRRPRRARRPPAPRRPTRSRRRRSTPAGSVSITITWVDFAARAALNAASSSAIDVDLHRLRAERARVGDEVDLRQRLVPRVAQQIVERRAAGRMLQPVDAAKAAVVVDDDDELSAPASARWRSPSSSSDRSRRRRPRSPPDRAAPS